jgi:hypothetical protein
VNRIVTGIGAVALAVGLLTTGSIAAAPQAAQAASCGEGYTSGDYVAIDNCTNMQMIAKVYYRDGRINNMRVAPYSTGRWGSDVAYKVVLNYYYY